MGEVRFHADASQIPEIEKIYGLQIGEDTSLPTSGSSRTFTTRDGKGPHLTLSPDFAREGKGIMSIVVGWDSPDRDRSARALATDIMEYLKRVGASIVDDDPLP